MVPLIVAESGPASECILWATFSLLMSHLRAVRTFYSSQCLGNACYIVSSPKRVLQEREYGATLWDRPKYFRPRLNEDVPFESAIYVLQTPALSSSTKYTHLFSRPRRRSPCE